MEITFDTVKAALPLAIIILIVFLVVVKLYRHVSQPRKVYLIYANWCGHCTEFKPTWERLKSQYGSMMQEINEKDKTALSAFTNKYGFNVESYPTIVAVESGKVEKFEGNRGNDAELIRFIKK
jgi:thiol-disulfide isomerase/thioredoxin